MTAYIVVAVLAILVLWIFFYFVPVGLWISALAASVPIGPMTLIGMRLRLAGGDVQRVVRALISADKAEIELNFQRAAAIDLAGRDVYGAVAMSVNPRVIETPKIGAVAKDGIQLFALARVTVRANIERLVGGATEETIIARVGDWRTRTRSPRWC